LGPDPTAQSRLPEQNQERMECPALLEQEPAWIDGQIEAFEA
jgi:hypothetical protein